MIQYKIMAIDDEEVILESIKDYFDNLDVSTFNNPLNAMNELKNNFYDIIIADYKMPDLNGLEFLLEAKKGKSYNFGILLTAFAEKDLLEQFINKDLIRKVIEKPLKLEILKQAVDEALFECKKINDKENEIIKLNSLYKYALEEFNLDFNNIVGLNTGLKEIFNKIQKIAAVNESVLITGETGTGKEIIAKSIHLLSKRKDSPFIKINCGAIPDELLESELFGYNKGAFTSANSNKPGKIELANNGTLFLDEIGELKPECQTKLLHVIQEKKLERLGSNSSIDIDFRLICATNQDLTSAIKEKRFRQDLYYRINTVNLTLPPLRDRIDDIPLFVENMADRYCREIGIKKIKVHEKAVKKLKSYSWPGNIRELENVIKRAILLNQDDTELNENVFDYLFYDELDKKAEIDDAINVIINKIINEKKDLNSIEKEILSTLLSNYNGNVMEAVKISGIPKDRFYRIRKKN
jgi:two-component system response regulator AtoC